MPVNASSRMKVHRGELALASQPRLGEQPASYTALHYDYSLVDERHREQVRAAAVEIRTRLRRTVEDMIVIGEQLNAVQEILHYSQFYEWAQTEFGLSRGSVFEFARIATRFAEKRSIIERFFTPTIVRRLAAVSVPDKAVDAVIAAAEASPKPLRVRDAMALVKPYMPPRLPKPQKQLPPPEPEPPSIEAEYSVIPDEVERAKWGDASRALLMPSWATPSHLQGEYVGVVLRRELAAKLVDGLVHRIFLAYFTPDERDALLVALTKAVSPLEEEE